MLIQIGLIQRLISEILSLGVLCLFEIIRLLFTKTILKALKKPESLIEHVADRKGHDRRYAIDPTKIHNELGWLPATKFEDGIQKTIQWYLDNRDWWQHIISGAYQDYYEKMYGHRAKL